jgi:galactosylceramidase
MHPIVLRLCPILLAIQPLIAATEITLDARSPGRVFEGIGAVSAGANTRNLPDYPEKERAEVLDYLFKPKFGAALQHLKVEIGGGDNSTCGSEPSHVITREELADPKPRGYEFWFMAEARKRNPAIQLDCLPWCYPGWISGRFSQDSADWFASFLDVAKKHHGLKLDWVAAAQNECGTDLKWVAHVLRPTLDRHGYDKVKIQGPDDASRPLWKIFQEFSKDPAYDRVLQAVGYHYPSNWLPKLEDDNYAAPEAVKATGKPLWASEEFSLSGQTWDNALLWARIINKNYIRDRITKTEAWCPVDALTPGIMWEGTGLMQANQPWTGHYEVWPAIWTTAHTTQFAEPGWRYLDSACGKFDPVTWKGSYVALRNPATKDWSLIVCTDKEETVAVRVENGLKTGPVHVWKSTAEAQFIRQPDAPKRDGVVVLTLEKNAVYTLGTTDGQSKGDLPASPAARPFPFPYEENFDACHPGQTPKYISDQKGTFETVVRPGGGLCLQQIVPKEGILWFPKYRTPFTVWGDKNWTDYTVKADVLVNGGSVELGGRWLRTGIIDFRKAELHEPRIALRHDGTWELISCEEVQTENKGKKETKVTSRIAASGTVANFDPKTWHTLSLTFNGGKVSASIDGETVGTCDAGGKKNGLAFLASSYDPNCFDNLSVSPATETRH